MRNTAGDHLRVWRSAGRFGYYHHGIYLADERVIQFGGRVRDKRHATIGAISLTTFEGGGAAQVVQHGGSTWWGATRFDALPRDEIVRRAEWLVATNPEGLYDLFGYNCEHAANFCATGAYESYQVRGGFAVNAVFGAALGLCLAKRHREGRPLSPRATAGVFVLIVIRLVPVLLYYVRGERFMRHVGRPWLAYERSLAPGKETPPSASRVANERVDADR